MKLEDGKASSLSELPEELVKVAEKVGLEKNEHRRSGSFMHLDYRSLLATVNELFEGQVELLDIKDALRKYDWLKNYYGRLIPPEKDDYTSLAENNLHGGYFVRAMPGAKVEFPIQACLMIARETFTQNVHNIVIAEEDSSLNVITGCITHPVVQKALHIGITEYYVKKGAKLNFTMIHSWGRGVKVRPRSATLIEEGGIFISNYICLNPVDDVQMYPIAICQNRGATARFNNIVYAKERSKLDLGAEVRLIGPESRGEIVSRIAVKDGSQVVSRGLIVGEGRKVRGHLECRGLLLDDESEVHAIPELVGKRRDLTLSHEAAVGKIAEKEIVYLMARGLTQEEAISTIIRGFLDVEIMDLPKVLSDEIKKIINQLTSGI